MSERHASQETYFNIFKMYQMVCWYINLGLQSIYDDWVRLLLLPEQLETKRPMTSDLFMECQIWHEVGNVLESEVAMLNIREQTDLPIPQLLIMQLKYLRQGTSTHQILQEMVTKRCRTDTMAATMMQVSGSLTSRQNWSMSAPWYLLHFQLLLAIWQRS